VSCIGFAARAAVHGAWCAVVVVVCMGCIEWIDAHILQTTQSPPPGVVATTPIGVSS
jgi:hypothetical protein